MEILMATVCKKRIQGIKIKPGLINSRIQPMISVFSVCHWWIARIKPDLIFFAMNSFLHTAINNY